MAERKDPPKIARREDPIRGRVNDEFTSIGGQSYSIDRQIADQQKRDKNR